MSNYPIEKTSSIQEHDFETLRPTTSEWTGRYERHARASLGKAVLKPGYLPCAENKPSYLPPCWSSYVHPEGQLYFARDSPLRIVTEADLYEPQTLAQVLHWSKHIEMLVEEKEMPLSEHIELFILIEDDGCSYYFIDHLTRTQFWLEEYETSELGIPEVASASHLQIALTELYWIHVEYFPMHIGGLPTKVADELISIWCHGLADQITSNTSTFVGLWPREESSHLLNILKMARDDLSDGHQVCVVARLWRSICHHRFQSHHGQKVARLSRDQAILHPAGPSPRVSGLLSLLTFNASTRFHTQLADNFVDELVHTSVWQPFVKRAVREWNWASIEAFGILLLHALLFYLPGSLILGVISAFSLITSILCSTLLRQQYSGMDDASSSEIYTHMNAIRSKKFGFHIAAFIFSLPTALQIWGLLLLCANGLIALVAYTGTPFAVVGGVLAVMLLLCLRGLTAMSISLRTPSQDTDSIV
ncbi:hypothetical protein PQX77_011968 [Marasmius sp. AFHP31]|nr:hypothetical protein PQX77_011968 [Marasmius sp. AFHP31]